MSRAEDFAELAMRATGRGPLSADEVAHAMKHERVTAHPVTREFADTLDGTKWRRLIAFRDVSAERNRQDDQWGGPAHDDELDPVDWAALIDDQTYWGMEQDPRQRFIKIAALAIAAIESLDRKASAKGGAE